MPKAIFHVQLNVRDFARSLAFYKALGFEEDHGLDFKDGNVPRPDLTSFVKEVGANPLDAHVVMLRLPSDPLRSHRTRRLGSEGLERRLAAKIQPGRCCAHLPAGGGPGR